MSFIPLFGRPGNRGKSHIVGYAEVDELDFAFLMGFRWSVMSQGYARRGRPTGAKDFQELMHRVIMRVSDRCVFVDHINGNKLDNRRCNLRLASPGENNANTRPRHTNTTGYLGVTWDKNRGKYLSQVQHEGRMHTAGRFDDPREAARARDELARKLHGEFAAFNFPAPS